MSTDSQGVSNKSAPYTFIVRTLLFIQHESDVLLLKGAPTKRLYANLYNGLGGHVEQGESIPDAARREALEEAGITAVNDLSLRAVITIETVPGILLFVFTGGAPSRNVTGSAEGIPEWVDWRTLPVESMVEDLPLLLPRVLERTQKAPLFVHYRYEETGLKIEFVES